ncbi:MAG TPA: TRAP transporter fused permease subunit [Candidatus Binatia bacterium]|nr:TRAP transporter fused permease subunit [Candidatus Binatia bacterium]
MSDDLAPTTRFRVLTGARALLARFLLCALTLLGAFWALDVHEMLEWTFFKEQYLGLFFALAMTSIFITVKARFADADDGIPWFDWVLALAGVIVGGFVTVMYPSIAYRLATLSPERWLLGGAAILLILEATRRLVGWALVWITVPIILYANLAYLFPGMLNAKGSSWQRIAAYLYLDSSGIFGLPLDVAAGIVVAFIFFGQALYAVGGDTFLTDIALVLMGRYRGGTAKVAVVSSTLFGTVSGSAVANVVVDGAITIPMMKKSGYPPHTAAAIEAVASNGGQIMPPVMGVAAFLMAEFLNISYGEVALAAAIPACLYYVALFTQIDLEAAKLGLKGMPESEIPKFGEVIKRGWVFLVPLGVLVYTLMFAFWEAGKAGMAAVGATFLVGTLQKATRPTFKSILYSVEETGRILLDIVVVTALAGLVIGAFQLSGLTFKFALLLVNLAGGSTIALLILTAIASIILGMSLPTTVVYIMLAVLVGPALVQVGIPPLAAHLFFFYFGMLSLITPPDCIATYAAASIARADFWKSGWTGMRLGIVAYIVPFIFVFHPPLLFKGSFIDIGGAILTAVLGVFFLAIGVAGFLFRHLGWPQRIIMIIAGVALIPPASAPIWLASNISGFVVAMLIVTIEWKFRVPPVALSQPGAR